MIVVCGEVKVIADVIGTSFVVTLEVVTALVAVALVVVAVGVFMVVADEDNGEGVVELIG